MRSTALIGLACLAYGVAMWTALPIIERHLFNGRFASEPMAAPRGRAVRENDVEPRL